MLRPTTTDTSAATRPRWDWLLVILDSALFPAMILAALAWLMPPGESFRVSLGIARLSLRWNWLTVLAPFLLVAVRTAWKRFRPGTLRGLLENALFSRLLLAVVAILAFFFLLEAVLVVSGFRRELPALSIREDGDEWTMAFDRELLWRFPSTAFRGRQVNNLGFLDRDVEPVKPPDTVRVICLGDSCTAQGNPTYAGFLHRLLTNAPPTSAAWEAFNMGVHGYSSVQGLRLFELLAKPLQPDYVTFYFGWNDHWLGTSVSRRMQFSRMFGARIFETMRHKRFFQLFVGLLLPRGRGEAAGVAVPPEEYRATLMRFVDEVRASKAAPILIVAPRGAKLAYLGKQYALSLEDAGQLHAQYQEITREVARAKGAALLDLAAAMSGPESAPLFMTDGIHLTGDGLRFVAAAIDAKLRELSSGAR
jgi:lysophospholipase L1-like esterase